MPGFGHTGLGGSAGWGEPKPGLSFGFVHNLLLTPMVCGQFAFVLLRRCAAAARSRGPRIVPEFGAAYPSDRDGVQRAHVLGAAS